MHRHPSDTELAATVSMLRAPADDPSEKLHGNGLVVGVRVRVRRALHSLAGVGDRASPASRGRRSSRRRTSAH